MKCACNVYVHILQYIKKYKIRYYFKNACTAHRIETSICKAVTHGLHHKMSDMWALRTGLLLPHEFGSRELHAWASHAPEVRKVKHLTVAIPSSLNASGIQGQMWLRTYPHDNQIGLGARNLSAITQVSCQHIPWEFTLQKSRMWKWVACACFALYVCVKVSTSQKSKWTFLIQMAAFLLIWNLFLKKCDRICGNGSVIIENFTVFYKGDW